MPRGWTVSWAQQRKEAVNMSCLMQHCQEKRKTIDPDGPGDSNLTSWTQLSCWELDFPAVSFPPRKAPLLEACDDGGWPGREARTGAEEDLLHKGMNDLSQPRDVVSVSLCVCVCVLLSMCILLNTARTVHFQTARCARRGSRLQIAASFPLVFFRWLTVCLVYLSCLQRGQD